MSSSREGQGKVKNRAPAAIQITAEQLLREAADFQSKVAPVPKQRVEDVEELGEYRGRKRKAFEEAIRRTRSNITEWTKYANWEAAQTEFARYVALVCSPTIFLGRVEYYLPQEYALSSRVRYER